VRSPEERERFDRIMAIFDAALELPIDQRSSHIQNACGGDDDLQKQVESLLEQTEADGAFLESGGPGSMLREQFQNIVDEEQGQVDETLPQRIGPYRILGLLGKGGMGTVYEAEQEHPRRRIALKVLRTPFITDQIRSRFEQESRILARLNHPGIAHIYDAGLTRRPGADPAPYFAMELVKGIPLTQYADEHALDYRSRLMLMAKIAEAVDHAHRKGVIHRDLKPDNILVDERGEPKVLDFGVARVVDREMTTHSMATATGLLIGTLGYMSPEQVGARPDEIDARSDVYALGVVAFELLASRLPLDLATVSIPEAALRIREADPDSLGVIDRKYRGDVSTIIEKALEKERGRRYPSAAEFSRDIRRYLSDEPILARPQSGFYQLQKFARRNKAIVIGVLVAFLALLGGTILATRQAVIADHERARAVELQQHAERQTYRARIAAATTALDSHDAALAGSNLSTTSVNQRGWEWKHLHARLDRSSLALDAGTGRFTELQFSSDESHAVVFDWSSVPTDVFLFPLSPDARPGSHFPVGMSRPLQVPSEGLWLATRSLGFAPGESELEIADPSGAVTHRLQRCGETHQRASVRALAADGKRALIWRALDGTPRRMEVQICDLYSGTGGPAFPIPYGWAFALSPEGSTLAVSPKSLQGQNRIEIFSTKDGAGLGVLHTPLDDVTALEFSPDGSRLAAGTYNGVLRLWDVRSQTLQAERRAPNGQYIYKVRFSPDGERIASGSSDKTIHVWTSDLTGDPEVLHGHAGAVVEMRFSQDGHRLISAGIEGFIRLWELDPAISEPQLLEGHKSYVNPICYSPDNRLIASGSWDGSVKLWGALSGRELATFDLRSDEREEFGVVGLAISRDGALLAAATTKGDLFVYDLLTGRRRGSTNLDSRLGSLEFSPAGNSLLVGTAWEDLMIVDVQSLQVVSREPFGLPFSWSPEGSLLLLRDSESSLVVRRGLSGPSIARLESVDDDTVAATWSPDSSLIVTASNKGEVRLWDALSGEMQASLGTPTGAVHMARFHPDGTRVAVAAGDGTIRLFDSRTREELVQLRGHQAYVFDLAWSPDGGNLVSASGDGTIRLWHDTPRRELTTLRREWSRRREEAARLVSRLLEESEPEAAASHILENTRLEPGVRKAALTELLIQSSRD
jgi:WD40 repeat protein/serine/threonine protein kinase